MHVPTRNTHYQSRTIDPHVLSQLQLNGYDLCVRICAIHQQLATYMQVPMARSVAQRSVSESVGSAWVCPSVDVQPVRALCKDTTTLCSVMSEDRSKGCRWEGAKVSTSSSQVRHCENGHRRTIYYHARYCNAAKGNGVLLLRCDISGREMCMCMCCGVCLYRCRRYSTA
jgi:hypothetical protein